MSILQHKGTESAQPNLYTCHKEFYILRQQQIQKWCIFLLLQVTYIKNKVINNKKVKDQKHSYMCYIKLCVEECETK